MEKDETRSLWFLMLRERPIRELLKLELTKMLKKESQKKVSQLPERVYISDEFLKQATIKRVANVVGGSSTSLSYGHVLKQEEFKNLYQLTHQISQQSRIIGAGSKQLSPLLEELSSSLSNFRDVSMQPCSVVSEVLPSDPLFPAIGYVRRCCCQRKTCSGSKGTDIPGVLSVYRNNTFQGHWIKSKTHERYSVLCQCIRQMLSVGRLPSYFSCLIPELVPGVVKRRIRIFPASKFKSQVELRRHVASTRVQKTLSSFYEELPQHAGYMTSVDFIQFSLSIVSGLVPCHSFYCNLTLAEEALAQVVPAGRGYEAFCQFCLQWGCLFLMNVSEITLIDFIENLRLWYQSNIPNISVYDEILNKRRFDVVSSATPSKLPKMYWHPSAPKVTRRKPVGIILPGLNELINSLEPTYAKDFKEAKERYSRECRLFRAYQTRRVRDNYSSDELSKNFKNESKVVVTDIPELDNIVGTIVGQHKEESGVVIYIVAFGPPNGDLPIDSRSLRKVGNMGVISRVNHAKLCFRKLVKKSETPPLQQDDSENNEMIQRRWCSAAATEIKDVFHSIKDVGYKELTVRRRRVLQLLENGGGAEYCAAIKGFQMRNMPARVEQVLTLGRIRGVKYSTPSQQRIVELAEAELLSSKDLKSGDVITKIKGFGAKRHYIRKKLEEWPINKLLPLLDTLQYQPSASEMREITIKCSTIDINHTKKVVSRIPSYNPSVVERGLSMGGRKLCDIIGIIELLESPPSQRAEDLIWAAIGLPKHIFPQLFHILWSRGQTINRETIMFYSSVYSDREALDVALGMTDSDDIKLQLLSYHMQFYAVLGDSAKATSIYDNRPWYKYTAQMQWKLAEAALVDLLFSGKELSYVMDSIMKPYKLNGPVIALSIAKRCLGERRGALYALSSSFFDPFISHTVKNTLNHNILPEAIRKLFAAAVCEIKDLRGGGLFFDSSNCSSDIHTKSVSMLKQLIDYHKTLIRTGYATTAAATLQVLLGMLLPDLKSSASLLRTFFSQPIPASCVVYLADVLPIVLTLNDLGHHVPLNYIREAVPLFDVCTSVIPPHPDELLFTSFPVVREYVKSCSFYGGFDIALEAITTASENPDVNILEEDCIVCELLLNCI